MRNWNRGLCVFLFCAVIAPCGCASLGEWIGELSVSEDGRITSRWESARRDEDAGSGSAAIENVVAIALAAAAALGVPFAYPVQRALRRRRDERAVTEHRNANGGAAKS